MPTQQPTQSSRASTVKDASPPSAEMTPDTSPIRSCTRKVSRRLVVVVIVVVFTVVVVVFTVVGVVLLFSRCVLASP